MASLSIKVTGTGATIHKADRGILTLQAQSLHVASAEEASQIVTTAANAIRDLIAPHCPQDEETGRTKSDAAISHYFMETMTTNTHQRPRATGDDRGLPYEISHSASARLEIKFSDFALLNTLVTQISAMEDVRIESVNWRLTEDTLNSIKSAARKDAARDALQRARDYAEVFAGLSAEEAALKVKAVDISEAGYFTSITKPSFHFGKGQAHSLMSQEKTVLQFEPQDIKLEVDVNSKFVVEV